jgi:membrane protein
MAPSGNLESLIRTQPMQFKGLKRTLKDFGLLWQALKKFNKDNGFFLSSGIAFNILINLIPFIMLLLALLGTYLYNDQEVLDHIRVYLSGVVPALDPKITESLMDVMQKRQIVGILGFLGLLWFSTWVFSSLRIALNVVFRVEKSRGILRGIGIDVLMILLVGSLLLASMILSSSVIVLQGYGGRVPITIGPTIQWILKYIVPFLFSCCMFFMVFKILPHKKVHFTSALQAAIFTGLLWELAKHLFSWYITHLAVYSLLYGSFSALIIFVLWVYYSSTILIVGAEFTFSLEENRKTTIT